MLRISLEKASLAVVAAGLCLAVLTGGRALADPGVACVDDSNITGTEDGTARWPFNTIGEAVAASADGGVIKVAQGTYTETVTVSSTTLYIRGGYVGAADYSSAGGDFDNANRDWEANVTTIDGENARRCVKFELNAGGEVSGFTMTRGNATDGGGIYCNSSSPTISDNAIVDNFATDDGGGIYCWLSSSPITNNVITGNETNDDGAGIYCENSSEPTITGNTITGNLTPAGGKGAGICSFFSSPTITGNTIAGNEAYDGGGIECLQSTPKIIGNIITGNAANDDGGGIYCGAVTSATITGNTIAGNTAVDPGGGIYCNNASAAVANNVITGNRTQDVGGGIAFMFVSSATITNNTIADNEANDGGGVYCYSSSPTITNCILWNNGEDLYDCTATYSCIEDGDAGTGNILADPGLAAPGHWDDNGTTGDTTDDFWVGGDYHLKSAYGRWDPAANAGAGDWASDAETSPCIDAGDPGSDYTGEPAPNFGRVNMGAYGNTIQASKSGWNIPGDATDDCDVDILDMIHIRNLLGQDVFTGQNWKADVTRDGKINVLDMLFVRNLLGTGCE